MKAINTKNQPLLDSMLAKVELYKNVPDQKLAYTHMAKQVAQSVKFI